MQTRDSTFVYYIEIFNHCVKGFCSVWYCSNLLFKENINATRELVYKISGFYRLAIKQKFFHISFILLCNRHYTTNCLRVLLNRIQYLTSIGRGYVRRAYSNGMDRGSEPINPHPTSLVENGYICLSLCTSSRNILSASPQFRLGP